MYGFNARRANIGVEGQQNQIYQCNAFKVNLNSLPINIFIVIFAMKYIEKV